MIDWAALFDKFHPKPSRFDPQRLREVADAIDKGAVKVAVFSQTSTEGDGIRIVRLNLTLEEKL